MTRREFTRLMLTMPLAPLALARGDDPQTKGETESVWLEVVQAVRGEPLDEAMRTRLVQSLKAQNELLRRLRQFRLPEGSEPSFVFHPVPPAQRRSSA
jgi:hypothetical protein